MNRSFLRAGTFPGGTNIPVPISPRPFKIGSCGPTDLRERAREILALTKMNWNSTEGQGRHPITISFAAKSEA